MPHRLRGLLGLCQEKKDYGCKRKKKKGANPGMWTKVSKIKGVGTDDGRQAPENGLTDKCARLGPTPGAIHQEKSPPSNQRQKNVLFFLKEILRKRLYNNTNTK